MHDSLIFGQLGLTIAACWTIGVHEMSSHDEARASCRPRVQHVHDARRVGEAPASVMAEEGF